jgi:predicted transcriptional regulator with C-terminal CBS domains
VGIGDRIKARRQELNMSQEELAQELSYSSKSSISRIESNRQNLTQNKIQEIAAVLDTTPAYLMGWDESAHADTSQANETTESDFKTLSELDSMANSFLEAINAAENSESKRSFYPEDVIRNVIKRNYAQTLSKISDESGSVLRIIKESTDRLDDITDIELAIAYLEKRKNYLVRLSKSKKLNLTEAQKIKISASPRSAFSNVVYNTKKP